ncbi:hypothetical protein C8R42DRAFT_718923 [Lentinula raphanica]|nr:hypothetical protein C8R42DRAFT_718923 [Lentinula raphanica]
MTHSTKSRGLALLVLAAAVSPSVLAAPASIPPPPLPRTISNPFSIGGSIGQASGVATLQGHGGEHANLVLRRDDGDLTIDDPGYRLDFGQDMTRVTKVSVSLERRAELDTQPSSSSSSTSRGRIPLDKVQENKNRIVAEITKLWKKHEPMGEESGEELVDRLKKDEQTIDAFPPDMKALLKEEHDQNSPSHALQNQQLREYQVKLQEIQVHAVKAARRIYRLQAVPKRADEILKLALENFYMSTVALGNLKGKGDPKLD